MTDAEKIKELQGAVAELLEAITSGKTYETKNPYSRPCVQRGLRALGRTTGISTFGSDWMDVLGKWQELDRTLKEIAS